MKSRSLKKSGGKSWEKSGGWALAVLALGALAAAGPARAQFPTSPGETGDTREVIQPNGDVIRVRVKANYLLFSPFLTTFQFKTTRLGPGSGQYTTAKTTNTGPFIQLEKKFPLEDTRQKPSSLAVGLWYWYHTSKKDNNTDRLGIYTQYNFNQNLGVQLTIGGATQGSNGAPSGLFEYYAFLLYSPTLPKGSRIGLQLGAGPYIPRHSVGDIGYTYTVGGVYKLTKDYALSASYWKVNYSKPTGTFGSAIPNDLTRTNLSVVYNFK